MIDIRLNGTLAVMKAAAASARTYSDPSDIAAAALALFY